jgi:hypothetical protein
MATARLIRLGPPGPHGPDSGPASIRPLSGRGQQACVLCSWLASAIAGAAGLVPLLAPVAVGFVVFA